MIKIYPIKSILHDKTQIDDYSRKLLDDLGYQYEFIDSFDKLGDDLCLILVQSGGSENIFLRDIYPNYKGPYYLLTYGTNNSLAASLEILSFIREKSLQGEILHGNVDYITSRIDELLKMKKEKEIIRLGVFDKPSDWLIGSHVDYQDVKNRFGIELVDIDSKELDETVLSYLNKEYEISYNELFSKSVQLKSYAIYEALKELLNKHQLQGFTIRCFDILLKTNQSACLALAKLNEEGYVSTCEGDIPSMISMMVIKRLFNLPTFQANPQEINQHDKVITLAHCTIPLNMVKNYTLMSHYESQKGMGIKGDIFESDVTVFKIGPSLNEFYCEEGHMIQDHFSESRCRTQVKITMDSDVSYFLKSSLANHHLIVYGRLREQIRNYLLSLGLKQIC